jgi:hypothetical protein
MSKEMAEQNSSLHLLIDRMDNEVNILIVEDETIVALEIQIRLNAMDLMFAV